MIADARPPPRFLKASLALAIAAAALAVYAPSLDHDFVSFDDWKYVLHNPELREALSLRSLGRAFEVYYQNWIPLTSISYQLDYALYGLEPAGYHATNALLHAAGAVLLMLALQRLTGSLWPSAFVAAVFALHPLHVESVAWVSSRKDVLSGVFFAATLLAYARYAERPTPGRFAWVFLGTTAGLLSKPTIVALPFVLLLLDAWPLARLGRRALVEKVVLLAPAAVISAVVLDVQPAMIQQGHPFDLRIANAIDSYLAYLRTSFWPSGLAVLYPHPGDALPAWRLALASFAVAGITIATLFAARRRPWLAVGWLWFLGMLVPVIGLVEVGLQARADRYMYLPQIGLTLMIAWAGHELIRRAPSTRRVVAGVAIASLALLALATRTQLSHWRDSESLYARAITVTERNAVAHLGLAGVYADQSRWRRAREQLALAIQAAPHWTVAYQRLAELEIARG